MKKKIAAISMTSVVCALLYFTGIKNSTAHDSGAPAGVTNSPHDGQSCDKSSCHNAHPLQSAKPWITSNIPASGYKADSVYTITGKAVLNAESSFGFEISPQTVAGAPMGTLIVTNSTTTQIVTSGYLQYMTQTINGYKGTDSLSWSFNWIAPSGFTDSVTFYGCFNCGSGTGASSGIIYPAVYTVYQNNALGVNNIATGNVSFSLFPNPANKEVNIIYKLKETAPVEVNMYSVEGRKVTNLLNNIASEGQHTDNLTIPASVNPGVYFIQLITNGQSTVQRIIVE
jgi:hypothetical protein